MGPLHANPLVFGFRYRLFGFVGEGAAFALDHVADIGFVADHHLNSAFVPQVVDTAGVGAALALIVQLTGRLDTLGVQGGGDLSERHAGGPHSKNTADQRRGFLVNDEMVLVQRVTLVADGRICTHVLPVLGAGFFDRFHLFTCVPAVKLVK